MATLRHKARQNLARHIREWQSTRAKGSRVAAALETLYCCMSRLHKEYCGAPSRVRRIPKIPVVSVGNVVWGGTGKTPFVEYITRSIERTYNGNVISVVLSRGDAMSKDETAMLEQSAPCAIISPGKDRFRAALRALSIHSRSQNSQQESDSFVAVLDDGLQHVSLYRDMNVIMMNCLHPFGINGHVLPRGNLREPLEVALRRAQSQGPCYLVFHHADLVSSEKLATLERYFKEALRTAAVSNRCSEHAILLTKMQPYEIWTAGDGRDIVRRCATKWLDGRALTLLSGIECSEAFRMNVIASGASVVDRFEFVDHHCFHRHELELALGRSVQTNSTVLTTHKDYARRKTLFDSVFPAGRLHVLISRLTFIRGEVLFLQALQSIVRTYLEGEQR